MIKFSKSNVRKVAQTLYRLKSTTVDNRQLKSNRNYLKFETKVPQTHAIVEVPPIIPIVIDENTIRLLEHLSLVDCANKQGIRTLEDAILFADKILHINTDNVEPMYTVLEDRYLMLRNDEVNDGFIQKDILRNASLTEEDYFVAPPGNIPLQPRDNLLHKDEEDK